MKATHLLHLQCGITGILSEKPIAILPHETIEDHLAEQFPNPQLLRLKSVTVIVAHSPLQEGCKQECECIGCYVKRDMY